MANLTAGVPLQPFGNYQRRTYLPIAASAQLYESSFLVQGSGALVVATTAGDTSTQVIGVSEYDIQGGATNGAVRGSVLNGREFVVPNPGGNTPPTDATPYGTTLYCDSDNSGGTVNTGSALPIMGHFTGMEPDGVHFRVFIQGW
jgi:hypothetical protein